MDTIFGVATENQITQITKDYGTPTYVYSESLLEQAAQEALAFPHISSFGLTVRYAMKALPTRRILQLFDGYGLQIDASSYFEVQRAQRAGIPAEKIKLTAQQLPAESDIKDFIAGGGKITACSLTQLETIGKALSGSSYHQIGIRINPGIGSGHSKKTNVGGSTSSFGIWHQQIDPAKAIVADYGLQVTALHTHIGSGSDPKVWGEAATISLGLVKQFPDVTTLDLGGGFKVARMPHEKATPLQECGSQVQDEFAGFYGRTGRKLHLEIEPGTYLVANAGVVLAEVIDVKATDRYNFILINSGMTEVTRPILYGAQHDITVLAQGHIPTGKLKYVVAGHCCESGDISTPSPSNVEELCPRSLPETRVGDLLVIGGAGAYCSGMSTKNYNSFPEAAEVLITRDGKVELIRNRQTLDQMLVNEVT